MLNNPQDVLSILMRGVLGRSGRKRARRAYGFLSGRGGFLTASTLMTAAGVAWGIYDSVKSSGASAASGALGASGATGAIGASGVSGVPGAVGAPVALPPIPTMEDRKSVV